MTLLRCGYFLTQIHKSTIYYNIVNCIIVWVSLLFMHYLVCLISRVIIRGKGNIKVICQTNTMIVNWTDLHRTNWHCGPLVYALTSGYSIIVCNILYRDVLLVRVSTLRISIAKAFYIVVTSCWLIFEFVYISCMMSCISLCRCYLLLVIYVLYAHCGQV